jgi:transposase
MGEPLRQDATSEPGRPDCPGCRAKQEEIDRLCEEVERLRKAEAESCEEKAKLAAQVLKETRAAKRQAAPFSKGDPKKKPKTPGRKAGKKYGRKVRRERPEQVDRTLRAELPDSCPKCSSAVQIERTVEQILIDLPDPRIEVTRFEVEIGCCTRPECAARVQGRHPLQISDALGAAAIQLGPRLVAVATRMKAELGVSYGKIARVFEEDFGLPVSRSALCRAFQRVGRKLAPTRDALQDSVRQAPQVSADETGWKVAGLTAWLWGFITAKISLYAIMPGRGFKQAAAVLGEAFSGVLVRDGWAPYRQFREAIHQTCIPHLLRRCRRIEDTEPGDTESYPRRVKRLLLQALGLRDRMRAGKISDHGFAVARGQVKAKLTRLTRENPEIDEHRKLAKHLRNEFDALLTFLYRLGVHASNWLAETELRPPIATRKACGGGNRTWNGARHFATILSVVRTARRQGHNPAALIVGILRARRHTVATMLLPVPPGENQPRPP